jgi:hypothetical protein
MLRIRAIVRILLVLLCLAPLASARQMMSIFAPSVPLSGSPINNAPTPIDEQDDEEDDEQESADGKERLTTQSRHRLPVHQHSSLLPLIDFRHSPHHASLTTPFDADPFHNGLGSPYRC